MSFYNPYQSGHPYRQIQGGGSQQYQHQSSGSQGHGSAGTQGSDIGTQPGGMYGSTMHYNQGTANQGPGSAQGSAYFNPASMNPGASPETLYMMQMIANIGNHINQLTQMMEKNYQMLHSTYDNQLDTKCVQGSGSGTVIVRM